MPGSEPAATWRRATSADAVVLRDLEREASLAGLSHVFGDLPYPADDVLARWVLVLGDPEVVTEVVDGPHGPRALAAYDHTSLRHLAVHPSAWGQGLGAVGVDRAVRAGATRLWVLDLNRRARGLYERLGWVPTGVTQECPWPPYPVELEYALRPDAGR